MKTSSVGINLIKEFEGCSLKAYRCPAGVWTIGYGHTPTSPGAAITVLHADSLLKQDLVKFEQGVMRLVKVRLTQGQFDALVSFAFNIGLGALAGSTLLRLLNAGNYTGAAAQFPRWVNGGGRQLPGLVRRRAAEVKRWGQA